MGSTRGSVIVLKSIIMAKEITPHEEILNYFENQSHTFEEGLMLFKRFGKNRSVEMWLERKRDQKKLDYELRKMLSLSIKDNGMRSEPTPAIIKKAEATLPVVNKVTPPGKKGENFRYLRFEKINPQDLPEDKRGIYDEIARSYKLQRSWHEKMKLAKTDDERAVAREEVVKLDDFIDQAWKGIDAFIKSGEDVPATAGAKDVFEISKEINACRSYISRNVPELARLDPKKKEKRTAEVIARINKLIEHSAPVSKETFKILLKNGLVTKESKLRAE